MNTDNFPSSTSNPGYESLTIKSDFPSKGCSTCRFFESSEYSDSGICHRYPHPELVNPNYWCGEWASLHGMFTK